MLNINTCPPRAVESFGQKWLFDYQDTLNSLEDAAQLCVQNIYQTFRGDDGNPLFALVRVYHFLPHMKLLPGLQQIADDDSDHWLALVGTYGDEADWCERQLSRAHQVVSPFTASPMFRASFQQLGLDWGESVHEDPPEVINPDSITPAFYVPNALDNPLIPDQSQFVEPYGIASVVGFGCSFSKTAGCLLLAFSREPITPVGSQNFAELGPFLLTLFAGYQRSIWR